MVCRTLCAVLALLAACATTDGDAIGSRVRLETGDSPATKVALPAGTRLQLLAAVLGSEVRVDRGESAPPGFLLDGWWRVAMRQSVRFDVAAAAEDCPSDHRIRLQFDRGAACFTTTLERDGEPPVALAAVSGAAPDAALDRLAWLTRVALGEVPAMAPIRCVQAYTGIRSCVRFTELGLQRRAAGDLASALQLFERARGFDGGCALTLLHLATTLVSLGGEARAVRASTIAREALSYRQRLTPQLEHRLARVLLGDDDRRLLELGRVYRAERPHDPHGAYSVGLALNRAGDYAESLPILSGLRRRWPTSAGLRYQLSFALLGRGDPDTALEVLDEAGSRLPANAIVRPYAMALFHAGKQAELRRYLTGVRQRPGVAGSAAELEILRMQASHAILTGDRGAAERLLAEGLDLMRRRSSELGGHALDVAEDGEVLLRLGSIRVLTRAIDGFHELGQLPAPVADALTYLEGLLQVHGRAAPTQALATLAQAHAAVWHGQLQAAVHHSRGELQAEIRALEGAVAGSTSPLLQARAVRALRTAGKATEAQSIADHLQRRLLAFDQRKPYEHPLMTPGRAVAHLATRDGAPADRQKR